MNTHETAGFCLQRVTPHKNYQTPPITYSGPNAIEKFLEHIFLLNRKKNLRDHVRSTSHETPGKIRSRRSLNGHDVSNLEITIYRIKSKMLSPQSRQRRLPFCGMPGLPSKAKTKTLSTRRRRGLPLSQFGFLRLCVHSQKCRQEIRGTRAQERHDVIRRRQGYIDKLGKTCSAKSKTFSSRIHFSFWALLWTPSSRLWESQARKIS